MTNFEEKIFGYQLHKKVMETELYDKVFKRIFWRFMDEVSQEVEKGKQADPNYGKIKGIPENEIWI